LKPDIIGSRQLLLRRSRDVASGLFGNKIRNRRQYRFGRLEVGDVIAAGDHHHACWARYAGGNGVHLGCGTVFVTLALDN
jgi:hypothetical protein